MVVINSESYQDNNTLKKKKKHPNPNLGELFHDCLIYIYIFFFFNTSPFLASVFFPPTIQVERNNFPNEFISQEGLADMVLKVRLRRASANKISPSKSFCQTTLRAAQEDTNLSLVVLSFALLSGISLQLTVIMLLLSLNSFLQLLLFFII